MTVGTKSLLFGVHAIWFHPFVVARAWKLVHKRRPTINEWICIITHDWGYFGCENCDGEQGKRHPERGAAIAQKLVYYWRRICGDSWVVAYYVSIEAKYLTLYHSSSYAREHGAKPSALFLPDKCSILFEPSAWYLFRAKLSKEVYEYIENSPLGCLPPELRTPGAWFNWYSRKVKEKLSVHESEH